MTSSPVRSDSNNPTRSSTMSGDAETQGPRSSSTGDRSNASDNDAIPPSAVIVPAVASNRDRLVHPSYAAALAAPPLVSTTSDDDDDGESAGNNKKSNQGDMKKPRHVLSGEVLDSISPTRRSPAAAHAPASETDTFSDDEDETAGLDPDAVAASMSPSSSAAAAAVFVPRAPKHEKQIRVVPPFPGAQRAIKGSKLDLLWHTIPCRYGTACIFKKTGRFCRRCHTMSETRCPTYALYGTCSNKSCTLRHSIGTFEEAKRQYEAQMAIVDENEMIERAQELLESERSGYAASSTTSSSSSTAQQQLPLHRQDPLIDPHLPGMTTSVSRLISLQKQKLAQRQQQQQQQQKQSAPAPASSSPSSTLAASATTTTVVASPVAATGDNNEAAVIQAASSALDAIPRLNIPLRRQRQLLWHTQMCVAGDDCRSHQLGFWCPYAHSVAEQRCISFALWGRCLDDDRSKPGSLCRLAHTGPRTEEEEIARIRAEIAKHRFSTQEAEEKAAAAAAAKVRAANADDDTGGESPTPPTSSATEKNNRKSSNNNSTSASAQDSGYESGASSSRGGGGGKRGSGGGGGARRILTVPKHLKKASQVADDAELYDAGSARRQRRGAARKGQHNPARDPLSVDDDNNNNDDDDDDDRGYSASSDTDDDRNRATTANDNNNNNNNNNDKKTSPVVAASPSRTTYHTNEERERNRLNKHLRHRQQQQQLQLMVAASTAAGTAASSFSSQPATPATPLSGSDGGVAAIGLGGDFAAALLTPKNEFLLKADRNLHKTEFCPSLHFCPSYREFNWCEDAHELAEQRCPQFALSKQCPRLAAGRPCPLLHSHESRKEAKDRWEYHRREVLGIKATRLKPSKWRPLPAGVSPTLAASLSSMPEYQRRSMLVGSAMCALGDAGCANFANGLPCGGAHSVEQLLCPYALLYGAGNCPHHGNAATCTRRHPAPAELPKIEVSVSPSPATPSGRTGAAAEATTASATTTTAASSSQLLLGANDGGTNKQQQQQQQRPLPRCSSSFVDSETGEMMPCVDVPRSLVIHDSRKKTSSSSTGGKFRGDFLPASDDEFSLVFDDPASKKSNNKKGRGRELVIKKNGGSATPTTTTTTTTNNNNHHQNPSSSSSPSVPSSPAVAATVKNNHNTPFAASAAAAAAAATPSSSSHHATPSATIPSDKSYSAQSLPADRLWKTRFCTLLLWCPDYQAGRFCFSAHEPGELRCPQYALRCSCESGENNNNNNNNNNNSNNNNNNASYTIAVGCSKTALDLSASNWCPRGTACPLVHSCGTTRDAKKAFQRASEAADKNRNNDDEEDGDDDDDAGDDNNGGGDSAGDNDETKQKKRNKKKSEPPSSALVTPVSTRKATTTTTTNNFVQSGTPASTPLLSLPSSSSTPAASTTVAATIVPPPNIPEALVAKHKLLRSTERRALFFRTTLCPLGPGLCEECDKKACFFAAVPEDRRCEYFSCFGICPRRGCTLLHCSAKDALERTCVEQKRSSSSLLPAAGAAAAAGQEASQQQQQQQQAQNTEDKEDAALEGANKSPSLLASDAQFPRPNARLYPPTPNLTPQIRGAAFPGESKNMKKGGGKGRNNNINNNKKKTSDMSKNDDDDDDDEDELENFKL